tara:strand:+ start:2050 stop:3774 length:1725 start_codon:yes stop_codon:yes gene_type:complete
MCGIFSLLNNASSITDKKINIAFQYCKNRGPEYSELLKIDENNILGFHRLAINGLDTKSNQPITINKITIICNGEIYNYKKLYNELKISPKTNSDCEVIIYLYEKYGIEVAISMLDGVFSFILYDDNNSTLYSARDPFGVRPLYVLEIENYFENFSLYGFASELKCLSSILIDAYNERLGDSIYIHENNFIKQFKPGYIYSYKLSENILSNKFWYKTKEIQYYTIPYNISILNKYNLDDIGKIYYNINKFLNSAVKKRVIGTSDRPVACLLSGGLDSSLIAALVSKYYDKQLETYSIGMKGSLDLKNARLVADHIKSKHHEIIVTEDDFFAAIPEVIYNIESYDTTTVRASVGNYLIGKYIAKHSDAKVIFNGDGSDELTGGYIYFLAVDTSIEFDKECRRLLKDIHNFDVLRSDKCISSHGLEPRTPFLDKTFVNYYLTIPLCYRNPRSSEISYKRAEKQLLREAFEYKEPNLLPKEILWRTKEAFSDGVSGDSGSWFEIISKKIDKFKNAENINNYCSTNYNKPNTLEKKYYRKIFDNYFPYSSYIIPYFWMPKYVKTDDASARTISFYNEI